MRKLLTVIFSVMLTGSLLFSNVSAGMSSAETESGREITILCRNINTYGGVTAVGDCILIQDNGINILCDSGKTNEVASLTTNYDPVIEMEKEYLRAAGVDRLDYVFCTHPHEDHITALIEMIKEFTVTKAVIMHECDWGRVHPSEVNAERLFFELKNVVERQISEDGTPMKITEPIDGPDSRIYLSDDSYMEFYLIPTAEQNPNEELNHTSTTMYYVYKDFKALITGDSDYRVVPHLINGNVGHIQVYKAQHHSANYNVGTTYSSQALLDLITPDLCVITAHRTDVDWWADNMGENSNMQRLIRNNITSYSTGRNGHIVVTSNGSATGFTLTCSIKDDPIYQGAWRNGK